MNSDIYFINYYMTYGIYFYIDNELRYLFLYELRYFLYEVYGFSYLFLLVL